MCLAATRHHADAIEGRKGAAANLSLNSTVLASIASTLATIGLSDAPHLGLLKSGLSTRSKVAFTSAELNGWPSCHFTFFRIKRMRFPVRRDGPALGQVADHL